jgi:hypothetical protein
MTKEHDQVPEGAAVFPEIPAELGVNPLLLALVHATIFLAGSEEKIVEANAADEALQYMASYLHRLSGPQLQAVREDMDVLVRFARQEKWPPTLADALRSLLADLGVGEEENA